MKQIMIAVSILMLILITGCGTQPSDYQSPATEPGPSDTNPETTDEELNTEDLESDLDTSDLDSLDEDLDLLILE